MIINAIDPGTKESALVVWDGEAILDKMILPNIEIKEYLELIENTLDSCLVIEMIQNLGMPAVGKDIFETVFWVGRFYEQFPENNAHRVYRIPVKLHHCHSARAKDANIRQALIDRFGPPGIKKDPGLTYKLNGHMWQAFALAVYFYDNLGESS